jgi:hypothetical protein
MIILDIPRPYRGDLLKIPLYHRGHLSLFPGARVWICLLPGLRSVDTLPELVISPVDFDSWGDLWRITMTMHERVGLVHDVLAVLKDHGVNVLASESSSMDRQQFHSLEMIVDATHYFSPGEDGGNAERASGRIESLNDLKRAIVASVFDDIALNPNGEPRIKIRRVRSLHRANQDYRQAMTDHRRNLGFAPKVFSAKVELVRRPDPAEPAGQAATAIHAGAGETAGTGDPGARTGKGEHREDVVIRVPEEMAEVLAAALSYDAPEPPGAHYLPVSETSDRFLRVYFIRNVRPVLSVSVAHAEAIGALATITDALYTANFDILTSLSRLYEHGARATFDLVLKPPPTLGIDIEAIRASLETALSTPTLVNTYGIEVSYPTAPRTYDALSRKTLSVSPGPHAEPRPKHGSTLSLLHDHYARYGDLTRRPNADQQHRHRFWLAEAMVAEESAATQEAPGPRSLFVSYSFQDSARFTAISEAAEGLGFKVITGRALGSGVNRDRILWLMQTCTCFLGVWTEDGAVKKGKKWWPSPWLHYEFGAAHALGLDWHLLISDQIDPDAWRRIVGDTVHTIFDSTDFERKTRVALTALATPDGNGHEVGPLRLP